MIRKLLALSVISAALTFGACAPSNKPVRLTNQHPPAGELKVWHWGDPEAPAGSCTGEPPAPNPDDPQLTDADVDRWEAAVLQSGRGCRDTVKRICEWHKRSDPTLVCAIKP